MHSRSPSRPFQLVTIADLSPSCVEDLLQSSMLLAARRRAEGPGYNKGASGGLAGQTLAAIFEKPSTRTRAAFCAAAFEEGALPQCLGPEDIHLGEKETIADTARVLSRFFGVIAWRGHLHRNLEELAQAADVPVINLLSDTHHPTQALADGMTMIEEFGSARGLKLVFYGDVTNNVARSLCELAGALGFSVTLSGPEALLSDPQTPKGAFIEHDPDPLHAARGADVIYTDVWTSMGFGAPGLKAAGGRDATVAGLARYQVDHRIVAATGTGRSIFMHCLPALRGSEVTSQVMDSAQSRIFLQAENRLHTIKAVLLAACGGRQAALPG